MEKSAVIFPYDISNISLILHKNLLNYNITHIVSPISWGYCFKDAGYDLGIDTSYKVECELEKTINEVDAIIFLDSRLSFNEFELFLYAIKFVEKNKDIVMLCEMNESYKDILKRAAKHYESQYFDTWENEIKQFDYSEYTLLDPPVPVIGIIGTAKGTGKFETLLMIKESIEKKGYSVLCISSKLYGRFLNVESYPDFMFDSSYEIENKIVSFNYFVNQLYRLRKSDIILIEVPGGIFPLTKRIHENISFQNYLVSNAINFDLCILDLHFEQLTIEYLNWLRETTKQKYNYELAGFIMSNNMLNWNAMSLSGSSSCITISEGFVEHCIEEFYNNGYNICGLFNKEKISDFTDKLIKVLGEESSFDCI